MDYTPLYRPLFDFKSRLSYDTRMLLSPFSGVSNIVIPRWWYMNITVTPAKPSRFLLNQDEWQEERERIEHDHYVAHFERF